MIMAAHVRMNHPNDLNVLKEDETNDGKEISCDICKKDFMSIEQLQGHNAVFHKTKQKSQNNYPCEHCNEQFSSNTKLTLHIRDFHGIMGKGKIFDCKYCGKKFICKFTFNSHVRAVHLRETNFRCKICGKEFYRKANLHTHIKRVHVGERKATYKCEFCDKPYFERHDLKVHMQNEHSELCNNEFIQTLEDETFFCEFCGKKSFKKHLHDMHIRTVHFNEKKFKCNQCESSFFHKSKLEKHIIWSHSSKEKIKCEHCGDEFIKRSELYNHLKTHLDIVNYPCKLCDKKFPMLHGLDQHMKRGHSVSHERPKRLRKKKNKENITWQCYCKETFAERKDMVSHKKTHHMTCFECKTKFSLLKSAREHYLNVHLRQKNVKCEQCDQAFFRPTDLRDHIKRVHTKEKHFKCDTCGIEHTRRCDLNTHIRNVHLKEKNVKCEYCGKEFFRIASLNIHVNAVHLKKKNHVCDLCANSYTSRTSLEEHILSQHKGARFPCKICNRDFSMKKNMKAHVRKNHPDDVHILKEDNSNESKESEDGEKCSTESIKEKVIVKVSDIKDIRSRMDNAHEKTKRSKKDKDCNTTAIKICSHTVTNRNIKDNERPESTTVINRDKALVFSELAQSSKSDEGLIESSNLNVAPTEGLNESSNINIVTTEGLNESSNLNIVTTFNLENIKKSKSSSPQVVIIKFDNVEQNIDIKDHDYVKFDLIQSTENIKCVSTLVDKDNVEEIGELEAACESIMIKDDISDLKFSDNFSSDSVIIEEIKEGDIGLGKDTNLKSKNERSVESFSLKVGTEDLSIGNDNDSDTKIEKLSNLENRDKVDELNKEKLAIVNSNNVKKKSYVCSLCAIPCPSMTSLDEHIFCQHKGFRFQCKLCKSHFSLRRNLRGHVIKTHPNDLHIWKEDESYVLVEGVPNDKIESDGSNILKDLDSYCVEIDKEVKEVYHCELCKRQFQNKGACNIHMKTCDLMYYCEYCNYRTKRKWNYTEHLKRCKLKKGESSSNCPHCQKVFKSQHLLNTHLRNDHNIGLNNEEESESMINEEYEKNIGNESSIDDEELDTNREAKCKVNDEDDPLYQPETHVNLSEIKKFNKAFQGHVHPVAAINQNLRNNENKMEENDSECKPDYENNDDFECQSAYQNNHIENQNYVKSEPEYDNQYDTDVKNNDMPTIEKHVCKFCLETFSTYSDLSSHVKTVHIAKNESHCVICDKNFNSHKSFRTHTMRFHLKEKSHQCKNCSSKFRTSGALADHIRVVHLKEKRYECVICGLQFFFKSKAKIHVHGKHLSEYKYSCKFCEFQSTYSHVLTHHMQKVHADLIKEDKSAILHVNEMDQREKDRLRPQDYIKEIHNGSKNDKHFVSEDNKGKLHQCKHCSSKFSWFSELDNHIRAVHLKEKRYKCTICGLQFYYRSKAKIHVHGKHLSESKYSCKFCEIQLTYSHRLTHHMRKVHGDLLKDNKDAVSYINEIDHQEKERLRPLDYITKIQRHGSIECVHKEKVSITDTLNQVDNTEQIHDESRKFEGSMFIDNLGVADQNDSDHQADCENKDPLEHQIEDDDDPEYKPDFHNNIETDSELEEHQIETKSNSIQTNKEIICEFCHEKFSTNYHLSTHVKSVHITGTELSCVICDKDFSSHHSFKKHILCYHLKERPHHCIDCSSKFFSPSKLEDHIRAVHLKEKRYECMICRLQFYFRSKAKIHVYSKHLSDHKYSCTFCETQSAYSHVITHHMQKVHGDLLKEVKEAISNINEMDKQEKDNLRPQDYIKQIPIVSGELEDPFGKFQCNICKKKFHKKSELSHHIDLLHTIHHCNYCDISFPAKKNLRWHMSKKHNILKSDVIQQEESKDETEHDGKLHTCEKCEASYLSDIDLKRHMNLWHVLKSKTCEYCSKEFDSFHRKETHVKYVHILEREWICETCGKAFKRQIDLNIHNRYVHLKERTINCDQCDKQFFKEYDRKRHILQVHIRDRSHKCGVCGAGFSDNTNLNTHIRKVHLLEKNATCEYCGKEFFGVSYLKTHVASVHLRDKNSQKVLKLKIESKEIEYKCKKCKITFERKGDHTDHMISEHTEFGFKCDKCGEKLSSRKTFQEHMQSHRTSRKFISMDNGPNVILKNDIMKVDGNTLEISMSNSNNAQGNQNVSEIKNNLGTLTTENEQHTSLITNLSDDMNSVQMKENNPSERDIDSKYNFECMICGVCFVYQSQAKKHLFGNHLNDITYDCKYCTAKYKWFPSLKTHIQKDHRELIDDEENVFSYINKSDQGQIESLNPEDYIKALKEFSCEHCQETFTTISSLAAHVKSDHGKICTLIKKNLNKVKEPCCKTCNETFKTTLLLRQHNQACHSEEKNYQCDKCPSMFFDTKSLTSHVKAVHLKEKNFECVLCGMLFFSKTHAKNHAFGKHLREKKYSCKFCEFKSTQSDILLHHMRKEHVNLDEDTISNITEMDQSEKERLRPLDYIKEIEGRPIIAENYECQVCKEKFDIESDLKKHINKFHVVHHCVLCDKSFAIKSYLKRHMARNHKDGNISDQKPFENNPSRINCKSKVYKCDKCESSFLEEIELKRHVKVKHKSKICEYCQIAFKNVRSKLMHVQKVHTLKRDWICETCGKGFLIERHMKEHNRSVHLKERNFHCDECGTRCFKASDLKTHKLQVHIKDRSFKCETCGIGFAKQSDVNTHIRQVHLQERNFKCEYCDKEFFRIALVKKHVSTVHLKERNYKCDICGKTFTNKTAETDHKIAEHTENGFKCEICGKKLANRKTFREHKQKHEK